MNIKCHRLQNITSDNIYVKNIFLQHTMAITLNTGFLRTVNGILKILEFCIILVVLLIARFGNNGKMINWCGENLTFLGAGSTVGFAIIVPAIVLTYLLGATPSILEFIVNLIGGILFISMGSTLVTCYYDLQKVVGGLSIALGIVFLVDFIYLCITTRFTIIQTTRTVRT